MSRKPSRRGFLGHVAGACVATTAFAGSQATAGDPVFGAIDAVKSNRLALDGVIDRMDAHYDATGDHAPENLQRERQLIAAAYVASLRSYLATVPTTASGMLAYLDFLPSRWGWEGGQMEAWESDAMRETFHAYVKQAAGHG